MIVISSTELRNNIKKYLDIADSQTVVIQRGLKDTYVLSKKTSIDPYEEIAQGITGEELLERLKPRIKKLFEK